MSRDYDTTSERRVLSSRPPIDKRRSFSLGPPQTSRDRVALSGFGFIS